MLARVIFSTFVLKLVGRRGGAGVGGVAKTAFPAGSDPPRPPRRERAGGWRPRARARRGAGPGLPASAAAPPPLRAPSATPSAPSAVFPRCPPGPRVPRPACGPDSEVPEPGVDAAGLPGPGPSALPREPQLPPGAQVCLRGSVGERRGKEERRDGPLRPPLGLLGGPDRREVGAEEPVLHFDSSWALQGSHLVKIPVKSI